MADEGYVSIDDPSISDELRTSVGTGVFERLAAYHELTPPSDIKQCMLALQRELYAIGALPAEERWRHTKEISLHPAAIRIEVRQDLDADDRPYVLYGRKPNKWFQSHDLSGLITYQLMNDDSGRTTQIRPPGLRDEDFVELWEPEETPVTLRKFLEQLTSRLDPNNTDDIPFIDAQERRHPGLLAMYAPDRKFTNDMPLTDSFREILSSISSLPLNDLISKISSDHTNFLIDGGIGGQLCLSIFVLTLAAPENSRIDSAFPYSVNSFHEILDCIAACPEGITSIRKACEPMQLRGEELQLSALDADSVGGFYGSIFESCLWLWGACLGYRYLSDAPPTCREHSIKISHNVCQERAVNALTSLNTGFLDTLDGRAFLATRAGISRTRRLSGEAAAEAATDHCIEVALSYPRYFKPILLETEARYFWRRP